jgi:RNA polymerase sigma-70 factor (ECF subfamily)
VTAVTADFAALRPTIEGLVLASTRDVDVAADATQEAFTRLFREAQAGRYPDHVKAWLYRTAMNVVISSRRRAAVADRKAPHLVRLDEPSGPEEAALQHERSAALRAAVGRLAPSERTALLLAASGVTGPEIASHLGRTHGATRTLMCRARGRLRRELDLDDAA